MSRINGFSAKYFSMQSLWIGEILLLIFSTFSGITSTAYMMVLNFLKSTRPSLLIKRAALGNLKAIFHCTHWHCFFPLKKAFFYLSVSPARRAPPLTKPSSSEGRM